MFKNPMMRRLGGAALVLIGLVTTAATGMEAYEQYGTASWPSVDGRIVSSSIETGTGRKGRTTYHPKVSYEYEVAGTKFAGWRVATQATTYSSESNAREAMLRYAPGSTVKVHHNPVSPNSSVLKAGLDLEGAAKPGFGVLMCIIGVVIVLTTKDKPTPAA